MALNPDYPKLNHNPFVTPQESFFGGGERQTQLSQLRHLSQWARRLLVVTGAHGMGKTTMFKALAASLPATAQAAPIMGTLVGGARDVLAEIAESFGIAVPDDAGTELLQELIRAHVADQQDRCCLVLIDDAHLIEPRAMQTVLDLLDGDPNVGLHMVLFAEVQILGVLERASKQPGADLSWHQIPLNLLDNPGIREYLQYRLAEAGHRGRMPFSERQIQEICQRSAGNIGRINEYADRALINLEREDRGFPSLHRAIAAFLAVVVIGAYFLWDRFDGDDESTAVEAVAVGEVSIPVPPLPRRTAVVAAGEDNVSDLLEVRDKRSSSPPAWTGPPREPGVEVSSGTGAAADITPDAAKPSTGAGTGLIDRMTVPAARPPQSTVAEASPPVGLEEPEPATASAVAREPVGRAIVPAPEPAGPQSVAAARPAQASAQSAGAAAEIGVPAARDEAWIRAQDPTAYTLQLLTTSSPANLKVYLDRQEAPGDFAVFKNSGNADVKYVVLYGLFENRESALAGARRLPAAVGDIEPWVRTLGSVHGSMPSR